MLKVVPRHKAKAIRTDILTAKEPVATSIFSQADEGRISGNRHLPGVDGIEVLDGFPDGKLLRVGEGEQEAVVKIDVVGEGRRQWESVVSFFEWMVC
jgi:hypothetical protein